MIDDIRPIARVIHAAFSLAAFVVVYALTWYTLRDTTTSSNRRSYWLLVAGASSLALSAALFTHYILDWVVGVP